MRFGMPRVFISDNGKPYISNILHSFLFKNKIRPVRSPIYQSSSNGISERINKHISKVLSIFKGKSIVNISQIIHKKINYNYRRTIKAIPMDIVNGVYTLDPDERIFKFKGYVNQKKIQNSNQ
ncbi:hypothetical protein DMUE_4333 [Dictyocoela muelleri]|nr:hypothetical protein DMUE_4333 [Dictyocoela muelleri]